MTEKNAKILIIDTSNRIATTVGLAINSKKYFLKDSRLTSQNLLSLIEKILKNHHLTLQDLTGIEVNLGPGSFTGLRVGVAVANALGWALQIPVNGKREIVLPIYQ